MFSAWIESSITHLYDSAVLGFPHTQARQHLVHTIRMENVRLTPFIGMRTLLVRGEAINEENGNHYNPVILLKNVNYNPEDNVFPFIASDNGQPYQLERLSLEESNVLLRCECGDFYWRFNYYDHLDRSLYGRLRRPYEALHDPGSANPTELPGMCKHLMRMAQVLENMGAIH